ncbi:MAG TPA: GntR family transcriptional regulator [Bordetella sp.]|jgi:DNA-binding GntR family transcriptional regulator|nr:GntR family transcriptional regulator [Bordetella sp.]
MDSFESALPLTAEEEAYRYILQRIRTRGYASGERLVPEEIATAIGTSRMPVREAFKRLASEGLVNLRPNRGALVRGLSIHEMEEVFNMRAVLEGLAARTALQRIGPAQIGGLQRLVDIMEESDSDVPQWVTAHRQFHEYLCRLSASPRLVQQIAALHAVVEPHMRLWLQYAEKPRSSREDHMGIVQAFREGDPARAEAVVREHIEGTVPALKALMVASGTTGGADSDR